MCRRAVLPLALMLCVTLGQASVSWGADAVTLDRARNQAAALRTVSSSLRDEQQRLRQELSQVSSTIEALKAKAKGKVLRDLELETWLRRSQELSSQLAALARKVAANQAELQTQQGALLGMLNESLGQLRTSWEKASDRTARRAILNRMKSLRLERDQLHSLLPSTMALPALAQSLGTDDPEELLEQADALRDIEDKVRSQLKRVEIQLAQAKEERAFDRRMDEFLGDEALFDDRDRRLRFQRPAGTRNAEPVLINPTQDSRAPPAAAGPEGGASAPEFTSAGGGAPSTPPPPTASPSTVTATPDLSGTLSAKTGQPQVLSSPGTFELEGTRDLEAEQKRLQALAAELNARASQLEAQARSLR